MGVNHARLEDRLTGFNELRRRALAVEALDAGCDVDEACRVFVRRERRHGTLGKADHAEEQVAARQGVDLPPGEAFDLLAVRRGFRAHSLARPAAAEERAGGHNGDNEPAKGRSSRAWRGVSDETAHRASYRRPTVACRQAF